MAIDDVLFYGIYVSQILVVLLYMPSRILRRARSLIEAYPPADFPKLYPVPLATVERWLRVYRNLNLALVVPGFVLLAAAWFSGYTFDRAWYGGDIDPPNTYPRALVFYTFVQLLPTMLFGYWQFRYFKRMRAAARSSIRTAELKARRLVDYVSPGLLAAVVATYIAAALLLLLIVGESPRRIGGVSVSGMSTYLFTIMTISNVAVAGMLLWAFYKKKLDPYQTRDDWARMIRLSWQASAVGSMLMSGFVGTLGALLAFGLLRYSPLLASLFVQAIWVPLTVRWLFVPFEQANYDVYRADAHRATAFAAYE
jgi:hypothetical protein